MHDHPKQTSTTESASPSSKEASARPVTRRRGREPRWRRWHRRLFKVRAPRTSRTMLPVLIQVFAGFTKVDGEIEEREIDSALGFLRYDYPETVYSELRQLYREALREPQDLNEIAMDLAERLSQEDKIMLGVQLYALISRADLHKDNLIAFYLFMTNLGIAAEAIDIVYQLNTGEIETGVDAQPQGQPLETLMIGHSKPADVSFSNLDEEHCLMGFRLQDLILLKNIGTGPVIVRGRRIHANEFIRLYEGQRVLLGEIVLDYQDIIFYFNAKKNVSSTRLYLSLSNGADPYIEKARTKQSYLEIKFGLGITIEALRNTPGSVNGKRLKKGAVVEVTLSDKIVFDNRIEIPMSDLRRRARQLGGRFDLNPTRSEYLISNNPLLLRDGDLLLSPGTNGEILLRIHCDYGSKTGQLEVLKSDRPIFIEDYPVRQGAALKDGDTITIGDGQFLRCHFSDGIIEEERNIISRLQVQDVSTSYTKRYTALDNISFSLERGEMICVMGPSGCGKSTLLKTLAGQMKPDQGKILLNGVALYGSPRTRKRLTPYISFIPHEEAIDPLLTVEENLDFAAAMRAPHYDDMDRKRRADAKLLELGLSEVRHRLAGDDVTKSLSGGQRKRLNVGLDMIGIGDVYLFDEPTSGLSSKDSEVVMEIIHGLSHNKIVFVSIHQPSAKLFNMFDKALLLDHGGKLAFFGTPTQMMDYFHQLQIEESMREEHVPPPDQPDFIFDVLETPLRDLTGDVIYEENQRGELVPARRFSPSFWRDRFQTYRLLEEVHLDEPEAEVNPGKPPPSPSRTMRDDAVHIVTLFKRCFISKMRNTYNLAVTLLLAPMLAVLTSLVLRYSEEGAYNFATAFHIPTYFFLMLVTGMFLGLTNSVEDILRDRTVIQRERNHRMRPSHYVSTKVLVLAIFAFVQCFIYVGIGELILSIRGMFWVDLFWMFATTMVGVIFGLLISSLVSNIMTGLNLIPLALIPQIILGGALIKYEEMNRSVDVISTIRTWLRTPAEGGEKPEPSNLQVPEICQIMPLRWSYEGIIVSHANFNPVTDLKNDLNLTIRTLARKKELTAAEELELDDAKNALAILAGLHADSPRKLDSQLRRLRRSVENGTFDPDNFVSSDAEDAVSVEQLYLNSKIRDLFNRAEFERRDYRYEQQPNVFFGAEKVYPIKLERRFFGERLAMDRAIRIKTIYLDALVLLGFCATGTGLLYLSVRQRMKRL